MRAMSAGERGDLAEALLPEAAGLMVEVREGTPEEIGDRLGGMSRTELEGLAVVLAALADPEMVLRDALAWVDFDEYGRPAAAVPRWRVPRLDRSVRDLVPDAAPRSAGVDRVAVERALQQGGTVLTSAERAVAVDVGIRKGMGYDLVASRLGMSRYAVEQAWTRAKVRARAEGRSVPVESVDEIRDAG
ncbi:hypothetical protein [Streptomyces sp. NPDC058657]|uniref:hypothetical protein n=1 Tax=unclassified Streptomyces TaxID=2593676 RepID=UPI0036513073